ncbi:MAG: VOC family protein [Pseudomonadota bacterium]
MISGVNHITFAVADLERALRFYRDVLGFREVRVWGGGAYLEAGSLWLCLSLDANASGNLDYSHVAFSVPAQQFPALSDRIIESGASLWKPNRSEGESLYFCCPDGHRLELHVGDLRSRLHAMNESPAQCCGAL